jgi:hypothetical protein
MLASCRFTPRNKALELHAGTKNGGCLTNLTEALSGSSFLFISRHLPPTVRPGGLSFMVRPGGLSFMWAFRSSFLPLCSGVE